MVILLLVAFILGGGSWEVLRRAFSEPGLPDPPDYPYSHIRCGISPEENFREKLISDLRRIDDSLDELQAELDTHRRPGHQNAIINRIEDILDDAASLLGENKSAGTGLGESPGAD